MRAITVRQPWAWAIIHGGKDVENRSRNIAGSYRGPVAIHAGKTYDDYASWNDAWEALADALEAEGCPPWESASNDCRGDIIGLVDLVDVHAARNHSRHPLDTCSPWADRHADWHLVLANPRAIPEPIPCRGRLGLWTVPDDIAARIEAAP